MKPLTVRQAAERLGVSVGLVYALVRMGRIRAERFGTGRGTIRIAEAALNEYRASCEVEPTPEASMPRTPTRGKSAFRNLDGDRLIAAWKEQD